MKKKLSAYDISYIMRKFRLKTVEDFAEYGLKLTQIGKGCSRTVYAIRGYNLVVKIPMADKSAKRHAAQEYKAFRRISNAKVRKYRPLRKYLPVIYCMTKDGIILMERYKRCNPKWNASDRRDLVRHAVYLFPDNNGENDIYGPNLGRDKKGQLKVVDMGCFFEW